MTQAPVLPTSGSAMRPHRGTMILVFGILGLVCCIIFGIMAWVPVKAVGALLAAVPLVYTGRKNLESFISCL